MKKIETMIEDYIDLVVPGSKKLKAAENQNFIKSQGQALKSIFSALKNHSQAIKM